MAEPAYNQTTVVPSAHLLQHEMRIIAQLQRRLLPQQISQPSGWEIAVHYPQSPWPGGDYYDIFLLPDGRLTLLVADASGHSGASAVMMAQVRTLLHSCPLSCGQDRRPFCPLDCQVSQAPNVVLSHLSRILAENSLDGHFMTAFYGILRPTTGLLQFAIAGHPSPRWWRRSARSVQALPDIAGLPLGIEPSTCYANGRVHLERGDALLCYTDGLTDAWNANGNAFGRKAVDVAIREAADCTAEGIRDQLLASFSRFLGGSQPQDNVTLVVVRRVG